MLVTVDGIVMSVSSLQLVNTFFPMVSTPSSRVAVFNAVHPLKAPSDICFTDLGMVMLVSPEPANAKVPMPVIVCGRVMLARLVQFLNAWSPILSVPSILRLDRFVQPLKALSLIFLT